VSAISDIRKRARIYAFAYGEMLRYDGMTLWDFCQRIMQLPKDAMIFSIREAIANDSIEVLVGSMEFPLVEDCAIRSTWIYDKNHRTFMELK
jgi:hypothetical protein